MRARLIQPGLRAIARRISLQRHVQGWCTGQSGVTARRFAGVGPTVQLLSNAYGLVRTDAMGLPRDANSVQGKPHGFRIRVQKDFTSVLQVDVYLEFQPPAWMAAYS